MLESFVPFSLKGHGREEHFERPIVMAILNVTNDSFFVQSRVQTVKDALQKIENLINQGSTIIDIGGQSTRPGSSRISGEEEWLRIESICKVAKQHFPNTWFSIDTYHSSVARNCMDCGFEIVNDISSGDDDENMLDTLSGKDITYIAMHKFGDPKTMNLKFQDSDVLDAVKKYFEDKSAIFHEKNINHWLLDLGFGFGKSTAQNFELMKQLSLFRRISNGLLVGISRKRMICETLETNSENALNGTTALHMFALVNGAQILRVHDAKEAEECIKLYSALKL